MKTQIKINELLPSTIVTRDSIVTIRNLIAKNSQSHVVFNFDKIEFVSRAFADEFLTMIDDRKIAAEFTLVSEAVSEVFEAVRRSRNNQNRGYQNIHVAKYATQRQLENFLSLI